MHQFVSLLSPKGPCLLERSQNASWILWDTCFVTWAVRYGMRALTAETDLGFQFVGTQCMESLHSPPPRRNDSENGIFSTMYGDIVSVGRVWYQPIDSELGLQYFYALKDIVARHPDVVSITFINSKHLNRTKSWLCNINIAGYLPPNIHWIIADHVSKEQFDTIGIGRTVDIADSFKVANMDPFSSNYGSPAYWRLLLMRIRLVRDLLDRGIDVFLFETHQLWRHNPFNYILNKIDGGAAMVSTLPLGQNISSSVVYFKSFMSTRDTYGLRFICGSKFRITSNK